MKNMHAMGLQEQGFLEQSLLSMTNEDGKKIKEKDAFDKLVERLSKMDDETEKAKLVLIGLMCLELKARDQEILTDFLTKTMYRGIEKNITKLVGLNTYRLNPKKEQKGNEILDRHMPMLENIVR